MFLGVLRWLTVLRIKHCHCCGLGCCSDMGLIPGLGTFACHRCVQKVMCFYLIFFIYPIRNALQMCIKWHLDIHNQYFLLWITSFSIKFSSLLVNAFLSWVQSCMLSTTTFFPSLPPSILSSSLLPSFFFSFSPPPPHSWVSFKLCQSLGYRGLFPTG